MATQQEGRSVFRDGRAQALTASDRRRSTGDGPARAPPGDISNLSDREIWRHFETTRTSAIFHLRRYFQTLEFFRRVRPEQSSVRLDVVPQSASTLPREFWDLKVSWDNLLNELDLLRGLLDIMDSKATKGLATSCCVVASLAVVVGAMASVNNTVSKVFWGVSSVVFCAATGLVGLRTGRVMCMRRCRWIIFGLYQRAQDKTLMESDKNSLEGTMFQGLWWSSLLLTRRPASDDD